MLSSATQRRALPGHQSEEMKIYILIMIYNKQQYSFSKKNVVLLFHSDPNDETQRHAYINKANEQYNNNNIRYFK